MEVQLVNPNGGAGSNPQAGGSSANDLTANPPAGGSSGKTPAQAGGSPAGAAGSNPPAGGSSRSQATQQSGSNAPESDSAAQDNAPVPAAVHAETVRAERALRKRLAELEARVQAQDDAKLTETERLQQANQRLEVERSNWERDRQQWRMTDVVREKSREHGIPEDKAGAALTLFMTEFGSQIDWDPDDGSPINAGVLFNKLVKRYPWLADSAPPQAQTPNAGRAASPPRGGSGASASRQPANAQHQQPKPASQWARLSDVQWKE